MVRAANEELKREVGERLALTRKARDLTQKEFAERAGMPSHVYNMIEHGARPLHIEDAMRICEVHGVTLDWIFFGEVKHLTYEIGNAIKGLMLLRDLKAEATANLLPKASPKSSRRTG